jgi:hypothetical protein
MMEAADTFEMSVNFYQVTVQQPRRQSASSCTGENMCSNLANSVSLRERERVNIHMQVCSEKKTSSCSHIHRTQILDLTIC